MKEHLIDHAGMLIFTTATPPYTAGQIGTALELAQPMNGERQARFAKAQRRSSGLLWRGWDTGRRARQIVPSNTGESRQALSATAYFETQGFARRAMFPPTVPQGSARLRFSLTSGISDDELVRRESSLNSWREQESWSPAVARV